MVWLGVLVSSISFVHMEALVQKDIETLSEEQELLELLSFGGTVYKSGEMGDGSSYELGDTHNRSY